MCENNVFENWGGGGMIWESLEATCSVTNEAVEGTKVRNDCGVSDWVRPIWAWWQGVNLGFEEPSDSENGGGSGEASDSESGGGSDEPRKSESGGGSGEASSLVSLHVGSHV